MSKQKAVIYARYSSSHQRDVSIEQQVNACLNYAKQNDLDVLKIYEDRAMTGTNDNRPGFQQMLRDSSTHSFEFVIVYTLDRFSRDRYDSAVHKHTLKENGVRVLSAMEHITDDPTGVLMESILEGFAEYYSKELAQKIRRGVRSNAEKGIAMGILPLGYKRGEDGRYAIVEEEALVVREVFQRVLQKEPLSDIYRSLNERGILTRNRKEWNRSSFNKMLSNEKYIGVYKHGDIRIEDSIPPIIDKEVFWKVQEYASNKPNPRNAPQRRRNDAGTYLLTGKLFCGECKSPMIGTSAHGKSGEKYFYYMCKANKEHAHSCKMTPVPRDEIEYQIALRLSAILADPKTIGWLADGLEEYIKSQRTDGEIAALKAQKAQIERELENTLKAIRNGINTPRVLAMMTDLEDQVAQLALKITVAEAAAEKEVTRGDILAFIESFQGGDLKDKRYQETLIDAFLVRAYIYMDRLTIVFKADGSNPREEEVQFDVDSLDSSGLSGYDISVSESSDSVSDAPHRVAYPNTMRLFLLLGLCVATTTRAVR